MKTTQIMVAVFVSSLITSGVWIYRYHDYVPKLIKITMPDGTVFSMSANDCAELGYHTATQHDRDSAWMCK